MDQVRLSHNPVANLALALTAHGRASLPAMAFSWSLRFSWRPSRLGYSHVIFSQLSSSELGARGSCRMNGAGVAPCRFVSSVRFGPFSMLCRSCWFAYGAHYPSRSTGACVPSSGACAPYLPLALLRSRLCISWRSAAFSPRLRPWLPAIVSLDTALGTSQAWGYDQTVVVGRCFGTSYLSLSALVRRRFLSRVLAAPRE